MPEIRTLTIADFQVSAVLVEPKLSAEEEAEVRDVISRQLERDFEIAMGLQPPRPQRDLTVYDVDPRRRKRRCDCCFSLFVCVCCAT